MRHTIPRVNWISALADALESAQDGDTVVVHNAAMQELAEGARQEVYPSKELVFEIQTPSPLCSIWHSEEQRIMGKKVIRTSKDEGRVIVGPNVEDEGWIKRDGKGHGTGKLNRQSSRDKLVRHR